MGNIAFASIVVIMALVRNKRKVSVGFFDLALPLLSAVAMNLAILRLLSLTSFSPIVQVVLSIALGGVIYVVSTLPTSSEIVKDYVKAKNKKQEKKAN